MKTKVPNFPDKDLFALWTPRYKSRQPHENVFWGLKRKKEKKKARNESDLKLLRRLRRRKEGGFEGAKPKAFLGKGLSAYKRRQPHENAFGGGKNKKRKESSKK